MAAKKKVVKKKVAKKKATKTRKVAESKDICFTIMPFGGWFDDYYTTIYCPAIENAGLNPCRADDLYRPSTIVHDIWSYTRRAKLILADLTGKNANVFYELGLAHALAKPAILVVENMDDVPFDLRALRIIEYNKNAPNWGDILKEKIETSIKEVLDAPAQSVLPAFLEITEPSEKTTVTEHEKELIEMRQDIDMLRRELLFTNKDHQDKESTSITLGISQSGAKALVRQYLTRGMPHQMIARNLRNYGISGDWAEKTIAKIIFEQNKALIEENQERPPIARRKTVRKKIEK